MKREKRGSTAVRLVVELIMMGLVGVPSSVGQTYKVLYNFGHDSAEHPIAGLTIDKQGNLYGSSAWGGATGNGAVYELRRTNSGFVYSTLHSFSDSPDGAFPWGGVTIAPDGTLYGTTASGGVRGYGTVFNVQPTCNDGSCSWTESVLYRFKGSGDGRNPQAGVILDAKGNVYGTNVNGGGGKVGVVYEMSPSADGWIYEVLYTFTGGQDGANPSSLLMFDRAGNLYGTAATGGSPGCGGFGCGTVYQLSPSGSAWTENTLYSFLDEDDGAEPTGGLVRDSAGNLYGSTCCGDRNGGTVFEISASGGNWVFNLAYDLVGEGPGPQETLVRDAGGNLYGSSWGDGLYGQGAVFKLTPTAEGWTYTSLHDFTGGADGGNAEGNLVMDSAGNLYGTTYEGGTGAGVVFEITP
jgi:uncharacterized repeat protein (TIGR03803 family)